MNKLAKALILLCSFLMLGGAAFVFAIGSDDIVNALPPQIQVRLPSFENPQTALPAPSENDGAQVVASDVVIPGLEPVVTPTETLAPTATPTEVPTNTPEPIPSATQEIIPTETPIPPTPTPIPPTPTPTPVPLPVSVMLEGITNVPQSFNNCGPANLSIALDYHGEGTTQAEAAAYLKPNPNDRNVSPWQISDFVNEQTSLSSTVHSGGTADMLKRLLAAELPPIIEKGTDFNDGTGWYGHYVTLIGYDEEQEIFFGYDTFGEGGWTANATRYTYAEVAENWKHFNYTFYVVYPTIREAEVFAIVGDVLLDEIAMWENAAAIAQTDIETDPADKYAWFNLGTSLTEIGRFSGETTYYEQGASAFDRARQLELPYRMLWYQHRPYMAYLKLGRFQDIIDLANVTLETRGGRNVEETYLWLGHALASTGDAAGARDAYTESIVLNENFYPAQIALDYLNR